MILLNFVYNQKTTLRYSSGAISKVYEVAVICSELCLVPSVWISYSFEVPCLFTSKMSAHFVALQNCFWIGDTGSKIVV
jgi:uncharacterized membrane protein